MSAISEEEFTKHEKTIQADLWKFRKNFYHGEDSDAYWESIVSESDRISKKHNSLYVDMMLIVCIDDIEYRYGNKTNAAEHFDHIVNMLRKNHEHQD